MRAWQVLALVPLLLLCAIPLTDGARGEITAAEVITVSGDHYHLGGADLTFDMWGVDETNLVVMAVLAHCEGQPSYWGNNQNFPGPDMEEGGLDCDSLIELFHQYFWLCQHYGIKLVRTGFVNSWATQIGYQAIVNHPTEFYQVMDTMLHEACEHDVYIELSLAGLAEYPCYQFGKGTNPLDPASTAFAEYVRYSKLVIHSVENSSHDQAIFAYDCWNEPDHDTANTGYWAGDEAKFHTWAVAVAGNLTGETTHIVDMGVNWDCNLWEWNYGDFLNATANCGFDIATVHYYATAEDDYLVTNPIDWAAAAGKPLLVGEAAWNGAYPLQRWFTYEAKFWANGGEALCSMVLRGTSGYPFVGTIPGDEEPSGTETGPETYPDTGGGGGGGGGDDDSGEDDLAGLPAIPLELVAIAGGAILAWGFFVGGKHDGLRMLVGGALIAFAVWQGGWMI